MDLEARGISCDAHSAVDKKLLSLPRPEREFGQKDSRDGHTWGTRGFCQGQRVVAGGRVQEGGCRRDGEGCSTVSPSHFAGRAEGHARGAPNTIPTIPQGSIPGEMPETALV